MDALLLVDEMRGLVHQLHQGVQVVGPLVESIRDVHVQTGTRVFISECKKKSISKEKRYINSGTRDLIITHNNHVRCTPGAVRGVKNGPETYTLC